MTDKAKSLRILSLDVENILRVVAVHVRPDGRVLELTGKNRQGKSSAIDALWMALGGEKMIPPDPIHDGADTGTIIVEIGNSDGLKYKVTRRLKRKEDGDFSTSLIVENDDGMKSSNPQKMLNDMVGALSCDPLEFIAMKPKDQFDLLKRFVPGVDFDELAAAHEKDFKERTDINRDHKALVAQMAAITFPEDVPAERIDESSLVASLESAGTHNAQIERLRAARDQAARDIETAKATAAADRARAAELRQQADRIEQNAVAQDAHIATLQKAFDEADPIPEAIDTSAVRAEIESARKYNAVFDDVARRRAELDGLKQRAAALEARSNALTDSIDNRNAAKTKAIAEAQMPIDGLGFGDGVILFDGHPLIQASQAQKLQLAISIATALQPRLRFITTKNAALLDDESWEAMAKMAEDLDLLIIAETVNSSRPTAVVIEDGSVRGMAKEAAE